MRKDIGRPLGSPRTEPLHPDDHIVGADSAPITVVSYCDFECPFCGRAFVTLKRLRERFGPQLRFVFRHFPLVDKHPFAQQAAEASEAAASQGRFWEMHDLLFEHQEYLDTDDLYRYAESAGLDVASFKAELTGHVHASRVLRDLEAGRRSGVRGTPTFFVNDARLEDDEELADLIERADGRPRTRS